MNDAALQAVRLETIRRSGRQGRAIPGRSSGWRRQLLRAVSMLCWGALALGAAGDVPAQPMQTPAPSTQGGASPSVAVPRVSALRSYAPGGPSPGGAAQVVSAQAVPVLGEAPARTSTAGGAPQPDSEGEPLLPPTYVRARLVPAMPSQGSRRTAIRVFWTRAPGGSADGYRVTFFSPLGAEVLQQVDVPEEEAWLDFIPEVMTVPLPQVQVQSFLRAREGQPERLSEPAKASALPHHLEPVLLEQAAVRDQVTVRRQVRFQGQAATPAPVPQEGSLEPPEPNPQQLKDQSPPEGEPSLPSASGEEGRFLGPLLPDSNRLLPPGTIQALAVDERSGLVWIGTDGGGLAALDPETGKVTTLTSLEGLPGDAISGLHLQEGPDGSDLWVVTEGGLARLEGIPPETQVDAYALGRDSYGQPLLIQSAPGALLQDRSGRIFVGTQTDGLLIFEPGRGAAQQLTVADGLSSDTLHELAILPERAGAAGQGGVLLLTRDGLQLLRQGADGLYEVAGGRSFQGAPTGPIQALGVTPDGQPLVVSAGGLLRLSRTGGNAEQLWAFGHDERPLPGGLKVTAQGHVLMVTEQGLRLLALPTGKELVARALSLPAPQLPEVPEWSSGKNNAPGRGRLPLDLPHPLDPRTLNRISSIAVGPENVVWLGLKDSQGLIRYHYGTGEVTWYRSSPLLIHGRVTSLVRDLDGQVWVGTEQGPSRLQKRWVLPPQESTGILPAAPLQATRPVGPPDPSMPVLAPLSRGLHSAAMPAEPVHSLIVDSKGSVLLGQDCARSGTGFLGNSPGCITRFDPIRGFESFFPADASLGAMDEVTTMLIHQGDLYVGTGRDGVRIFLPNTGDALFEHPLLRWKPWLTERRIVALAALGSTLWIGTREGLLRVSLNPQLTNVVPSRQELLPSELPAPLASLPVNALLIDHAQNMWVATERGLWRCTGLNREEHCQVVFAGSIDRPALSLALDSARRLWVGTTGGLYRTSSLEEGLAALSEEPVKLLPERRINAVLVEDDGSVWVGTERGLLFLPPLEPLALSAPMSPWLVGMVGASAFCLVGFLLWYRSPRRRDPLGESLMQEPELLTRQPLYTLPELVAPLRTSSRLGSVLLRIELDAGRFDRVVGLAGYWPGEGQVATREQVEALAMRLAPFLGAELLPAQNFRRKLEHESVDQHSTTQDFLLDPPGPQLPPHAPHTGEQQPEGYDLGAPGVEEWKGEGVGDSGETPPAPGQQPTRTAPMLSPAAARGRSQDSLELKKSQTFYIKSLRGQSSDRIALEDESPLLFVMRLPELPIRLVQREVPLVVVRVRLPDEQPAVQISRMLRELSLSSRYVLVLNLVAGWSLPTLSITGTRFIPLNEEELRGILYARDLERALIRHVIKHVKITEVSPYSSKGEVTNPSMFVGRRFELDKIISSEKANFLIVGARQIGKSSLMGALKRYYKEAGNRQIYSLTLSLQEDARSFYRRIALLLKKDRVPKDSNGFAEMLELNHRENPVPALFLIDEVDGLLARERQQGYPVLTAMRRLQQQDTCWFILAGYWELVRLGNDYHSPLFNMSEVIELGSLKSDEARELILKPLQRMALGFDNYLIVDEIVAMTAGQPHLIQFICNQLLERMNARRQPLFTRADWEAVREGDELKTYVTRNFKSNAGLLEEVVVYATLQYERFSHAMLETALDELGLKITLRAREESLRKLKLVGILKEIDGEFQFALPIFRRVMLKEDTMWFARARAREMQEGSGS